MSDKTVQSVIQRSINMHPSLYREAIQRFVQEQRDYENKHRDSLSATQRRAASIAGRLATRAGVASACIAEDNLNGIMCGGMDCWLTAFNIACRLQCLPPSLAKAIVADSVLPSAT